MKTVNHLYVPTKNEADTTANSVLFNNSGCSSFTELLKISASHDHQQSQDSSETSNSPAARNPVQKGLTEGTVYILCSPDFKYLTPLLLNLHNPLNYAL